MKTNGRAKNAAIAADTMKILNNLSYLNNSGKTISLDNYCILNTELISENYAFNNKSNSNESSSSSSSYSSSSSSKVKTKFEISLASTLEASKNEVLILKEKKEMPIIGVLNFASAMNPGGGFLGGSTAQEESIARSSQLYSSLTTPLAKPYYALHRSNKNNGIYSHSIIYSPKVGVFKDDQGNLLDEVCYYNFVTSPAVNSGCYLNGVEKHNRIEVKKKVKEIMKERMRRVLLIFKEKGNKILILGSWGTGVFRNEVQDVANWWKQVFEEEKDLGFEKVIFAIYDEKTFNLFKQHFGS